MCAIDLRLSAFICVQEFFLRVSAVSFFFAVTGRLRSLWLTSSFGLNLAFLPAAATESQDTHDRDRRFRYGNGQEDALDTQTERQSQGVG